MAQFSDQYRALGQIITQKLRDESFAHYQQMKDFAKSMSAAEYRELERNPRLDPALQRLKDERFELLNQLDNRQTEILDRLVLSVIDLTAFNFLREVEEHLDEEESIGLTIKGQKVEGIADEFLSGTLFGEYHQWVEEHSKYGSVQH